MDANFPPSTPVENLPDGRYLVAVERVALIETPAGAAVSWTLRVTGPAASGRWFSVERPLDGRRAAAAAEELALCGLVLADLPAASPAGGPVEVTVLASAGVWFHRRLGAVEQGDGSGERAPLAA